MAIDKRDKKIIIIIIVLMLVLSVFFLGRLVNILVNREGNPNDLIYRNKIQDSITYRVYLKENTFIDTPYVVGNMSYVSILVEYINIVFNYDYKGYSNIELNYIYNIKANVISEYSAEGKEEVVNPVWNKEFILVDNKEGNSDEGRIKINENLNISLDYYNSLVGDFRNTLNVPIDSRLEVKLSIDVSGTLSDDNPIDKEHYMLTTIPLGVKAFDVATSKNFVEEEKTYSEDQRDKELAYVIAIIYIVIIILINVLGISIIKRIINKEKPKYEREVKKILKDYGDRVVTVSNFINYDNLEIVDVSSFDEILNLSDETFEPIIYWENRKSKVKESWFSILRNKVLYRYIYKEE